jgi:hypothetical protein
VWIELCSLQPCVHAKRSCIATLLRPASLCIVACLALLCLPLVAGPTGAGKTHSELAELEGGIQEQLDSGAAADPEYWQAVLRRLALAKAKSRLRELHAGGWAWGGSAGKAPWTGICKQAPGGPVLWPWVASGAEEALQIHKRAAVARPRWLPSMKCPWPHLLPPPHPAI